jgi:hypothetical protein
MEHKRHGHHTIDCLGVKTQREKGFDLRIAGKLYDRAVFLDTHFIPLNDSR